MNHATSSLSSAGPRIGSLCTGYGGLDMAAEEVFGGTTAWVSDIDPGACQIIAHRMPGVPNIGDLTTADWATLPPVDIILGGYPCQPFSTAGRRKGTEDERHIWPYIATALRVLRPRIAVFENVAGHLRLGFDTVLAALASIGFDAEWITFRASDVGAPHQRARLFIVATAADAPNLGHERGRAARGRWNGPADGGLVATHADRGGQPGNPERDRRSEVGQPERELRLDADGHHLQRAAVADAPRLGWREGRAEPEGQQGRLGVAGCGAPDWGRFGPAIARWERVTGHRAPGATDDRGRLSPAFVEWMMGLPSGWVTDVPGLTRTAQLKALGNGVVPQQAAAAIRALTARSFAAAP